MKGLFRLAGLLVLLPVGSFAQGGFAGPWPPNWPPRDVGPLWKESDPVEECYKGTMHLVSYVRFYLGSGNSNIVVHDEDLGTPCDCMIGPVQQARPSGGFFSLLPHQESNCQSGNTQGVPVTIPGQQAAGATGGFGGGGGGFAGGPSPGAPAGPPSPPGILVVNEPRLARHTAAPGSAFTFTLPFRDLPNGPLLTEVTSQVPFTCNSSLNPTMFRVWHTENVVKRYNLCTGQSVATIRVPALPLQVRVTPDGSQAIVTSYSGAITFIDTGTNTVTASVGYPSDPNFTPSALAISPNGQYALVSNYEQPPDSYLAIVDVANMQITGTIPLDTEYPESVFINPDGTLAWITYPWDNVVEVIDVLTGTLVQTLTVLEPFSIVFNPTGTRAFVSSGFGSVEALDTGTYDVIMTIPAGLGATDLQITPDGAFIYVNNSAAQSVTVIDTQTLTGTTLNVGAAPQGSTLVPVQ